MQTLVERNFLAIVFFLSVVALFYPQAFVWGIHYIPYLLGVIMFGMGLTLQTSDFINVWKKRRSVFLGILAQYSVMPLLALMLGMVLHLPEAILIGMVLLGACPGGTASNVITYLAKGNVALSVTMTLVSTLLAPVVTPAVVYFAIGKSIDIHYWAMVKSVFWIVAFPLADGFILRRLLRSQVKPFTSVFPSVSIVMIAYVIAVIMALNRETILTFPAMVFFAVVCHNLLGLGIGYSIGKLFSYDPKDCRTLSIEVGMQNSGLGVSLAATFFSAQSALPCALFSLWHNISGIVIAKYWSRKKD